MEKTIAKSLLEVRAVSFGFEKEYYTYQGIRLPVYCDNRTILSQVKLRKAVARWLALSINKNFPDADFIIGTAVAGISFAVLVSQFMGLPMLYIWDDLDKNDELNILDGVDKNSKFVIVDDVINTGDTLVKVFNFLRDNNLNVLGAVSIFSYELPKTIEMFAELDIKYTSLTNYDVLTLVSLQTGKITYDQYLQTIKYKENPYSDDWLK